MSINIPQGWALSNLGSIATYINGRAFKPTEWETTGKPIIRIQNLNNPTAPYNYTNQEFQEKYRVKKGNLLFAWSASLGTYIWKNDDAWLNQHIFKVIPHRGIDKNFLFYLLTHVTNELYAKAHGSGMVHVTKGVFDENPALIPPIKQQILIVQKIEELFSEIDDGIQSLETTKKQLDIYRQSLFKNAFAGNFTIEWRNTNNNLKDSSTLLAHYQKIREDDYLKKFETWKELNKEWEKNKSKSKPSKPSKLKKIVEVSKNGINNFPDLPNSWNYVRLGFLIEDPVYGTSKKCDYESNDGIGVLRIPNISEGCIDSTDLKFAYFSDEEISSLKLEDNDLLTIRSNGSVSLVGKTALVRGTDTDKLFAGYLIRLRPFKQHVNGKYLHYAFESQFVRNQIEFLAKSTSGVNNINSSELQSLIIPIPSLEEQNEIVNQLDNLLDTNQMVFEQLEVEIKKAYHLKSSILSKAFSGQLVPQDPNDEPASVLLERIKAEKEEELAKAKANKAPKKPTKRKTKATKENEPAQQELI